MTRRLHPSIPAISLIIWWLVASIVFPARMLNSDGDLLRHIGHGEWMLRHHSLIHFDPFSFTKGGQPFVGFEYGSQLIYALVHRAAGLAGVAIFAGLLIATAYALLARFLLSRGVDALLTYLVTVAAAVLGAVHWAPRPHLFTLLFVVILLPMLEGARREMQDVNRDQRVSRPATRDPRPLWALPLFAIWANLHGGFVFGLVLIGIYWAGHALDYLRENDKPNQLAEIKRLGVLFGAGVLGTLINPHFIALHRHIAGILGDRFILDNTQEFLSPDFHSVVGKLFLLALLGIIALLATSRSRLNGPHLLLLLGMTYLALNARRNMQLFGVTVLPVLAIHFDASWRTLPDWRGIRAVFERDSRTGQTTTYVLVMLALFGFLSVGHGKAFGREVIPNGVSPDEFPVGVVRKARAEHLQGNMYHDFVWGGYLIYAWPEQKVFIDGGTDFYGAGLLKTWMDIGQRAAYWRDSLAAHNITLALVPTNSGFVHELLREPGWRLHDCDATAVLLQKVGGPAQPAVADSLVEACARRPASR